MSEGDAEWIDVEKEFKPLTRPPPPHRTTTTATPRPRNVTPTRPGNGIPRPRRPRPRPGPRDAPERAPPPGDKASSSYNATTISVSVVSVIFLLALVLLLLYLFVLRKKLRKMQQKNIDGQYSLRVEDVSHLDVDDSAKLYVNTTDLQKLVASVRVKNKRLPPPIPEGFQDYPDVVNVGRPPLALPKSAISLNTIPISKDEISTTAYPHNTGISNPALSESNSSEMIYSNVSQENRNRSIVSRPAPPIPTSAPTSANNQSFDSDIYSENTAPQNVSKPPPPFLPKPFDPDIYSETTTSQNVSKPPPPFLPKHFDSDIVGLYSENTAHQNVSKPLPPFLPKPVLSSTNMIEDKSNNIPNPKQKPAPPVSIKPKPVIRSHPPRTKPVPPSTQLKPLLPPLKINLRPSCKGTDSGFSTPDTAITYVYETETPDNVAEPEAMSVKARRAMLEGVLVNAKKS